MTRVGKCFHSKRYNIFFLFICFILLTRVKLWFVTMFWFHSICNTLNVKIHSKCFTRNVTFRVTKFHSICAFRVTLEMQHFEWTHPICSTNTRFAHFEWRLDKIHFSPEKHFECSLDMYYISSENLYKIHSKCDTYRVNPGPCVSPGQSSPALNLR